MSFLLFLQLPDILVRRGYSGDGWPGLSKTLSLQFLTANWSQFNQSLPSRTDWQASLLQGTTLGYWPFGLLVGLLSSGTSFSLSFEEQALPSSYCQ